MGVGVEIRLGVEVEGRVGRRLGDGWWWKLRVQNKWDGDDGRWRDVVISIGYVICLFDCAVLGGGCS